MKTLNAIIIDDERLARKELLLLLGDIPQIRVVGEADCIAEAVRLVKEKQPHVVFLDIQLAGESGFQLLDEVELTFEVVFVTAFDQYAVRAFEVNAMDYLMKPVNPERLQKTLERLWEDKKEAPEPEMRLEYDDTLFEKINDSLRLLKIESIICIEAEGDYSRIKTKEGNRSLVTRSLKKWESLLPSKHFLRIHRSTIINIEYVEKIEKWFHNSYRVYMKGVETPFDLSRRYALKLKKQKVF